MKHLSTLIILAFILSCTTSKKKLTAQQIVDNSINTSGLNAVANATISFNFRDKFYKATRQNGAFKLERQVVIKKDTIKAVYSNAGLKKYVNSKHVMLTDSVTNITQNAINSVHYFAVLPYGLNDKAVVKKRLPDVTIKEKTYYKIQITFKQKGGGTDFEDVFIYWIDKTTNFVTFLAYDYHTNGGGKRFRAVKKEQLIKGLRFADYNNYKPANKQTKLEDLDQSYANNSLIKVSEIVLENLTVKLH